MVENQKNKGNDMPLRSLEKELRSLPKVKIPEKLKAKILAAIPSKQRELSIEYQRKWYLAPRDFVATAAAAIFIFISMLMVSYGLPNPPQKMLTGLNDTSMWYTTLEQNYILIGDSNYTNYDEPR